MSDQANENKFPPRVFSNEDILHDDLDFIDWSSHRINDEQIEYLSLTEHQHILAEKDKRIERLREALEFYSRVGGPADTHDRKGCWILARRFCFTEAIAHDIEKLPIGETGIEYYIAGKRARAALQEDGK